MIRRLLLGVWSLGFCRLAEADLTNVATASYQDEGHQWQTTTSNRVDISVASPLPPTGTALVLGAGRIYPNPWRADSGETSITFDQWPANSTISIFTVSGQHLKTLNGTGGKAVWDLSNDSGQTVSSGLYLYVVTSSRGTTWRGRLAIIR